MLKDIDSPIEKRYFKTEEVAELCGVTTSAIRWKADRIKMQVRRGARGHRLFTKEQVDALKAMYRKEEPIVLVIPKRPYSALDEIENHFGL